jgi:ketosteroid isomerase-like protein
MSGTWFGSIVLSDTSGKISHDTAVVVIATSGSMISGGMGRTIDQMTPWSGGSILQNKLTFRLDAAGGLDVTLEKTGDHLAGSAKGQRFEAKIDLRPAPGLLPHEQLEKQIAEADRQLYRAFEACDVTHYAAMLSSELEFYQDHTGKTNYEENLDALRDRCAEGIRLRRSLEEGSLLVDAAPGFGAIQAGIQQFYSVKPDGQEHLDATARFTNVWSKASGQWKLVRVISFDHK